MTLDLFKAQARRLQSFLKSNPSHAAGLAQGKHASCLEAVAAVQGARNWNTLQASPDVFSQAGMRPLASAVQTHPAATGALQAGPEDLPPVFGGLRCGQVQYFYGTSGTGKSHQTAFDAVAALASGYTVTVLEVGRFYRHLALAFNGASTIPEQAAVAHKLVGAPVAAFEFEGWLLTHKLFEAEKRQVDKRWAQVLPFLQQRQGPGHVLVVDELATLQLLLGNHRGLLVDFLVFARERGSLVHVIGQTLADFDALLERLPATRVLHAPGRPARKH